MWVKKKINHPPIITIFIGGMVTIPRKMGGSWHWFTLSKEAWRINDCDYPPEHFAVPTWWPRLLSIAMPGPKPRTRPSSSLSAWRGLQPSALLPLGKREIPWLGRKKGSSQSVSHGGTPEWMLHFMAPNLKWTMTGGIPILGNQAHHGWWSKDGFLPSRHLWRPVYLHQSQYWVYLGCLQTQKCGHLARIVGTHWYWKMRFWTRLWGALFWDKPRLWWGFLGVQKVKTYSPRPKITREKKKLLNLGLQ